MFLGIEGSANKIGVGIFDDGEILSNIRKTFCSPAGEGFLPKDVALHHRECICELLTESLQGLDLADFQAICFTRGPGMAPPLISMAIVARMLSLMYQKPLVAVNHCIAHIEMGRFITKSESPVILYVSGGNTQVLGFSAGKYRIFGETIDIAIGNCLDRCARDLRLSNYPSPGYQIEQLAKQSTTLLELPYSVKGMDVAFSGISSQITSIAPSQHPADISYSLQETAFAMLTETTERALAHLNLSEVLIVGGVGCNLRLQGMVQEMLAERSGSLCSTSDAYCIDNGAMIAYTGSLYFSAGMVVSVEESACRQRYLY
jgi:N6-L-threonylcarbamoyladenine synthase